MVSGLQGDDHGGGQLASCLHVSGELRRYGGVVWFQGQLLMDLTQPGGQAEAHHLRGVGEEDVLGVGEPAASCVGVGWWGWGYK